MHNYSLFSELILTTFVGSQTHNSDAEGPLNASLQTSPPHIEGIRRTSARRGLFSYPGCAGVSPQEGMFMENLRFKHLQLAGLKLHTRTTINSKENTRVKTEEITLREKKKKKATESVSRDGKMNNFSVWLKM